MESTLYKYRFIDVVKTIIHREQYLQILRQFKDKNVIKVAAGVRRCGKSTIFAMFQEELKKTGVKVIGKNNDTEIDFVVQTHAGNTEYYQVVETLLGEETRTREIKSLKNIRDHFPKYIITMDSGEYTDSGIRQINALDWLLTKDNYPLSL